MKVQESAPTAANDERKTTDLCDHEHVGARCMRRRGHEGRHECFFALGGHALHWD